MMNHKKIEHTANVCLCWNYSTGRCTYGEKNCWFIHKGQSSVPEFKYKIRDEHFYNRTELQQHRKIPAQRRQGHSLTACNAAPPATPPRPLYPNGRWGPGIGQALGYWTLRATFAK